MNNPNHNQHEINTNSTANNENSSTANSSNPLLLMANDLEEDRTQLLVSTFLSSVRSNVYQNQQQS